MENKNEKELAHILYADFQLQGDKYHNLIELANPVHGTLRYTRPDTGEVLYAAPNNPNFSKAILFADKMFDADTNEWVDFLPD